MHTSKQDSGKGTDRLNSFLPNIQQPIYVVSNFFCWVVQPGRRITAMTLLLQSLLRARTHYIWRSWIKFCSQVKPPPVTSKNRGSNKGGFVKFCERVV